MEAVTVWGTIDARPILFPVTVQELNNAVLVYEVPVAVARTLLPGDAFSVVEDPPGRVVVVLSAQQFRRTDWGPYNSVDVAVAAHPTDRAGDVADDVPGVFTCPAVISERFVSEVAYWTVGTAKTLGQVRVETTEAEVAFEVFVGGERALRLALPRVRPAADAAPQRLSSILYAYLNAVPHATRVDMDWPQATVDPADVTIELGTGPMADALRSVGLPEAPKVCVWGEGLTAVVQLPRPIAS
jgi:hypothetical protein